MHENEFTIVVKDLEEGPQMLTVNCRPAALELEDPEYTFPETIRGQVIFKLVRPRVVATGKLETIGVSECVRCLGEARVPISAPVALLYENEKEMREGRSEVVTAEEQIVTPFNGEWIQPEEELRESIVLELPPLPLCKPDCKGLCPRCGANLNDGPCACPPAEEDDEEVSSWKDALKGLKLEGDKSE